MTSESVAAFYADLLAHPALALVAPDVMRAYEAIASALERGGTLFLCGNGGSFSDALHISGELLKSFARPRPLPEAARARLREQPYGAELAEHLQAGLRAHVLGCNPALASAVANDIPVAGIGYAQELCALARPGDVLLGISTSGRARNVLLAVATARALGLTTIGLTGQRREAHLPSPEIGRGPDAALASVGRGEGYFPSPLLADLVDIALCVPERETYRVQELHLALYHQLCLMLEARFFST